MTAGTEALAEAMRLEQARIYGQTMPDTRTTFVAPIIAGTGPADPEVLQQLIADLDERPKTVALVSRVAVEQHIARGHDDQRIAAELDAPLAQVRAVRADLDRLAS